MVPESIGQIKKSDNHLIFLHYCTIFLPLQPTSSSPILHSILHFYSPVSFTISFLKNLPQPTICFGRCYGYQFLNHQPSFLDLLKESSHALNQSFSMKEWVGQPNPEYEDQILKIDAPFMVYHLPLLKISINMLLVFELLMVLGLFYTKLLLCFLILDFSNFIFNSKNLKKYDQFVSAFFKKRNILLENILLLGGHSSNKNLMQ